MAELETSKVPIFLVYLLIFMIGFSAILAILATITTVLQNFSQQSSCIFITCMIVYYKIGKIDEDSMRRSGCSWMGERNYHIIIGVYLAIVYIGAIFA